MVSFNVERSIDQDTLAKSASDVISGHIKSVLKFKDRFKIALSGGSTPRKAYKLLSSTDLPWHRVDVFLGDERWVSHDDETSNALMLRQTLLASDSGSKASFHPVPTTEFDSPERSAHEFSNLIRQVFKNDFPCFDLILLGLGEDGHTASLFPGTDSLNVKNTLATVGRGKGQERISLTAEVLSAASKVIFLVSGVSKQIALKRLLDPNESYERTPARLVQPKSEVSLLVDDAAAGLLI
ncbi:MULTISPECIES: 6-phosphogluconolactonase [unclassified Prochlorococcus]|uniref:6-phosphogluconolactonase n=1 Tax=unclassified Prochlorococcus TaxID=2627481 RepID=UPI0005339F99|nr:MULTISPECIES: 6-phosphogluconolactonase [unclassified Prochlorococcus]KGG15162.1 6-phosphogluconolactonase [Prochlorococcus sp. MIT 0602]KGG17435.1 6-phosphogluconolactonase [Prochlorococcus sp. MIT 0603]